MLPERPATMNLLDLPKGANLGAALVKAMDAIERDFEPLLGQLPKDYGKFENDVLEDLLRMFDSETLRTATGDVFGRIYDTSSSSSPCRARTTTASSSRRPRSCRPSSTSSSPTTAPSSIRPAARAACSCSRATSSSTHGQDTRSRSTSTARRRTSDTIRLAKMNLAVHGLEGEIAEAITYYEDEHEPRGKCDFVMANPPFNVDVVDAEQVKGDRRLPFGLPGVNKAEEGLQRQLPLDLLLLELPEREGPRRLRHVVAGLERRPRRGGGAPEDRRDRRRGCDDLHPRQLLLHPHRALRAVALRPEPSRPSAATRC